jgi:hypothetical protein
VARRLFERLEQRVERRLRQHVDFVDQVDLHPTAAGHVLRVVDELAHIVHARVAGRVDFQQVDEPARIDVAAGVASPRTGSAEVPRSQFSDLAKMRAMVVLPTPRVPVNRNA